MFKEKYIKIISLCILLVISFFYILLNYSDVLAIKEEYYLTLSSSGSQNINVSNVGDKTSISADSINVITNCSYGYNFILSTSVNDNNLYRNGDSANNASGTFFSPTNGTYALKDSSNTWGYYYNRSALNTAPTSSNVFSPVPVFGEGATITPPLEYLDTGIIQDSFNIYYGVSSSDSMPIGTYKMIPDTNNDNNDGTIVYNATISDSCISYTVHFNPAGYFEGNLVTGGGTMSDQTIYEGVATPLANVTFNNPTRVGDIDYYFAGWNTAQDGSGTSYYNSEDVTNLIAAGNSITLYAQWTNCPPNNICYTANGSNIIGEMSNETISSSGTSVVLYAPNYKRDEYGFAAWNTKVDGTGTNYGPQATINFAAGQYNTGGLRLYAKWVANNNNMQGWAGCYDMSIGDVIALKDVRDNNVYAVAKLADGDCWMIENLRLNSENSHDSSLAQGYGGLFIGLAESEDKNFTYPAPENSLYKNDQSGDIYGVNGATKSDIYYNGAYGSQYPRYNKNNTNIGGTNSSGESLIPNPSDDTDTAQWYGYGNYYTWNAAIADTTYYNGSSVTTTSICPKDWFLPEPNDFGELSLALGGNTTTMSPTTTPTGAEISVAFRSFPNNFVYAGMYNDSSPSFRNSRARYATNSSRRLSSNYPNSLDIRDTYVYPGIINSTIFTSNELLGISVRCMVHTR